MADRDDPRQQDRTQAPPPPQDIPMEEDVVVEDSDSSLTPNDPLSGMEEPYGSQVLRMWYEAFILQMQEVDSVLQPLDNPKVIKLAMTIQQSIDKMIQAIQALHAGEYESRGLPPLSDGVGEVEEEVMVEEEPETIEEMRPTPDEAAEGMQDMGLRGKSLTYDAKALWNHMERKAFEFGQMSAKHFFDNYSIKASATGWDIIDSTGKRVPLRIKQGGKEVHIDDLLGSSEAALRSERGGSASRYTVGDLGNKLRGTLRRGGKEVSIADHLEGQGYRIVPRLPKEQSAEQKPATNKPAAQSGSVPDNVKNRMAGAKTPTVTTKPKITTQEQPKLAEGIVSGGDSSMESGGFSGSLGEHLAEGAPDRERANMYTQVGNIISGKGPTSRSEIDKQSRKKKSYEMKCLCGKQPCACSDKNLKESGNKYPQAGDWIKKQSGTILKACDFLDKISTEDEDGGIPWGEKSRQEAYHLFKVLEGIVPGAEFKEKETKALDGIGADTEGGNAGLGSIGNADPSGMGGGDMGGDMGDDVAKSFFPVRKFLEVISGEKAFGYQHQEAARACKSLILNAVKRFLGYDSKATLRNERGDIVTREEYAKVKQRQQQRAKQEAEERNRNSRYDVHPDPNPWFDPASRSDVEAYAAEMLGGSPVDAASADQAERSLQILSGERGSQYAPGEVDEIMSGVNQDVDLGSPEWRGVFEGLQEGEEIPVYEEYPGRPGEDYLRALDNFQLAEDPTPTQPQGMDYSHVPNDALNTMREMHDAGELESTPTQEEPTKTKKPGFFESRRDPVREDRVINRVLSQEESDSGRRAREKRESEVENLVRSRGNR